MSKKSIYALVIQFRTRLNEKYTELIDHKDLQYLALKVLIKVVMDLKYPNMQITIDPINATSQLKAEQILWIQEQALSFVSDDVWGQSMDDDFILSTIYQAFYYQNREDLDLKILQGHKLTSAIDIADKTQLFTDRYMVDWIIQNTLTPIFQGICKNNQWDIHFPVLYDLPYAQNYRSLREIKLIDPAMGTGNFFIVLIGELFKYYEIEYAFRGLQKTKNEILDDIFSDNLYGIDICPRVFEIALYAITLKCKKISPDYQLKQHHFAHTSLTIHIDDQYLSLSDIEKEVFLRFMDDFKQIDRLGVLIDLSEIKKYPNIIEYISKTSIEKVLKILNQQYEVVLTNPPYLGIAALDQSDYLQTHYPLGKSDLYSAFWLKSMDLCQKNGLCAMLTLRNWMFLQSFQKLREYLLNLQLCVICDLKSGAFEEIAGNIVNISICILQKNKAQKHREIPVLFEPSQQRTGRKQLNHKKELLLHQKSITYLDTTLIQQIPGKPFIYWWSKSLWQRYQQSNTLEDLAEVKIGLQTGFNDRFLRKPWEIDLNDLWLSQDPASIDQMHQYRYVPYIKGANGQKWFESINDVIDWRQNGMAIKSFRKSNGKTASFVRNEDYYFKKGIAYSTVGSHFSARFHLYLSIFDVSGASIFHPDEQQLKSIGCFLNSLIAQNILNTFNPTVNYQANDVKRLFILDVKEADRYYEELKRSFEEYEKSRETSLFFQHPQSPHQWLECQSKIEQQINAQFHDLLPSPHIDPKPPKKNANLKQNQDQHFSWISYLIGVYLGRFSDTSIDDQQSKISGLIWMPCHDLLDDELQNMKRLNQAWIASQGHKKRVKHFILDAFFQYHLKQYEQRPIYWLFSSSQGHFNALIYMKKLDQNMIEALKQIYLFPLYQKLNPKEVTQLQLRDELSSWIQLLDLCFQQGPGAQMINHRYEIDLNDGVLVNAAPLWPLLYRHWQEPKKIWQYLTHPTSKDYDWSQVAMRYFSPRVLEKIKKDPSLSCSHGLSLYH